MHGKDKQHCRENLLQLASAEVKCTHLNESSVSLRTVLFLSCTALNHSTQNVCFSASGPWQQNQRISMIDLIGNALFVLVYNIPKRYNPEVNYTQSGMCPFAYKSPH